MNSIIRSVWLSALVLGAQVMAEEDLGHVGESCRARSDCMRGLICKNEVCTEKPGKASAAPVVKAAVLAAASVPAPVEAPRPVESTVARSQLNPSLAAPMVAQEPLPLPALPGGEPVFTSEMELPPPLTDGPGVIKAMPVAPVAPAQVQTSRPADPAPAPSMVAARVEAPAPVEPEAPKGITDHNHFFIGISAGAGPAQAFGSVGPTSLLAAPGVVRVGGLFHFFEIALEANPGLFVGTIAEPHFSLGLSIGAQITVFKRETFALVLPLRVGGSVDFVTGTPLGHADVLGLGLRMKHLYAEVSLFSPHGIAPGRASNGAVYFPFSLSISYLF